MENVKIETRDNKATIIIDLGYRGNLSPTGKSFRVASTCGSKTISGTEIKTNNTTTGTGIIPSPFPVGGKRYGKIL